MYFPMQNLTNTRWLRQWLFLRLHPWWWWVWLDILRLHVASVQSKLSLPNIWVMSAGDDSTRTGKRKIHSLAWNKHSFEYQIPVTFPLTVYCYVSFKTPLMQSVLMSFGSLMHTLLPPLFLMVWITDSKVSIKEEGIHKGICSLEGRGWSQEHWCWFQQTEEVLQGHSRYLSHSGNWLNFSLGHGNTLNCCYRFSC